MASLENRNGSWRLVFMYDRQKYAILLGRIPAKMAHARKQETEWYLGFLREGYLHLPPECNIKTYIRWRGHPPSPKAYTVGQLRDDYLAVIKKRLDAPICVMAGIQFKHVVRILGGQRPLASLGHADLQRYVDVRGPERAPRPIAPQTIQKEIGLLRRAWRWARTEGKTDAPCPELRLYYPKGSDRLPFMTLAEVSERQARGDTSEGLSRRVYLLPDETADLLEWVRSKPRLPAWVWPMFCFAAHTGARRAEMLRTMPGDVSLTENRVTLRERKREAGKLTYRQVPLTPLLREALAPLLWECNLRSPGSPIPLFHAPHPRKFLTPVEATRYFRQALRGSRWEVLSGWHVFRHSFISALASNGTDQRIIDDLVGHSTEQQRRRYRHLFHEVKQQAVSEVFPPGESAA